MSLTIAKGLEEWMKEINNQIANCDNEIADLEYEVEMIGIKYNVVCLAKDGIPHNQERQQHFYETYVKEIKELYEKVHDEFKGKRTMIYQKKSDLQAIKLRLESAIKEV